MLGPMRPLVLPAALFVPLESFSRRSDRVVAHRVPPECFQSFLQQSLIQAAPTVLAVCLPCMRLLPLAQVAPSVHFKRRWDRLAAQHAYLGNIAQHWDYQRQRAHASLVSTHQLQLLIVIRVQLESIRLVLLLGAQIVR